MATVKVFSSDGVKELNCFDTLDEVPFLEKEEVVGSQDPEADE